MAHPLVRVGKVASGLGRLWLAGRSVQRVADAVGSGDYLGAAKHVLKVAAIRGLFKSGVSSMLDGLAPSGDDGPPKKGG